MGEKRTILESAVSDFNCSHNEKLIVERIFGPAGGSVTDQLVIEKTPAARPQLALVEHEALPLLADKNLILPLDDFLERSTLLRKNNWRLSARASVSYRGRVYGIPITLNPYVLIYNPQLLSEINGDLPTVWTSFFKMQDVLSANSGRTEKLWMLNSRSIISVFSILCIQNGITSFKSDELLRKRDALAGILQYIKEMREQRILPPYYKFWDPKFQEVTGGNVIFQLEDAGTLAGWKEASVPLDIAPMPSDSGDFRTALSHNQVLVLCRTDDEPAVRDFVEFFFSSPHYNALIDRFFFVSPLKHAPFELDDQDPLYKKVVRAAENAAPLAFPLSEKMNIPSRMERAVARMEAGMQSREQAAEEILKISGESRKQEKTDGNISISWAESTRRIFADDVEIREFLPVRISCARNEHETFQLVLAAEGNVEQLSLGTESFWNAAGAGTNFPVVIYKESDSTIDVPLVSDRPGPYPNVLEKIKIFDLNAENPVRLWVDVFVPKGVPAGKYRSTIKLSENKKLKTSIPVELDVFPFEIPSAPSQPAVAGLNYDLISRHYKLKPKSEQEQKILNSFYWCLVEHRLTPYQPPVPLDSPEMSSYMRDERVTGCRIPFSPSDARFDSIVQHAQKGGWLKKLFVYFIDEPTYHQYSAVAETGRLIHSRHVSPKFLVTCLPEDSLLGAVDIFCIHLSFLPVGIPHAAADRMEYLKEVKRRIAAGDEIWWYTAGAVKPLPTLQIEDDPAAFRIIPWMQQFFGLKGFLNWEAANWIQPIDEPFIPLFGNGEGILVYPGESQPNPSVRLELLREGLEDLEYLFLLRRNLETVQEKLSAQALGDVATKRIRQICRRLFLPESLQNENNVFPLMFFDRAPGAIERVRMAVAEEIENLGHPPLALVLTEPEEKQYTESENVRIFGVTEPGCKLSVNDKYFSANSSGAFSIQFPLTTGENVFRITFEKGEAHKTIKRTIYKL